MKKDKNVLCITIGIICLILTAVMYAQFKLVEQTDIAGIETAREDELKTLVSTYKTKYEEASQKLANTKDKLE